MNLLGSNRRNLMKKLNRVLLATIFAGAFLGVGCEEAVCVDNDYEHCYDLWLECQEDGEGDGGVGDGPDTTCDTERCICLDDQGCVWGYDFFNCF
jgi:hypothetical protein